jgi:hypothetical protein
MITIRAAVVGLVLAGILATGIARAENVEAEKAAVAAAKGWLALVDGGKYGDSWQEAARYLKKAVNKEQLTQSLQAAREPLGKLVSRTVKSRSYATELPGAPDGEYVVIQFTTSFANKKSAIETVTPVKEKDGKWRVSGYYIR